LNDENLAEVWGEDYAAAVRRDAHQLLAWSYADTKHMLIEAKDEYEITGLLSDGMNARIDSVETPERFTMYAVQNEKPTSPFGQKGKDRPKLDIQIERCGVRPKEYFTFEAKRMRDDSLVSKNKSMKEYLGSEGIDRFLSEKYSSESSEAAMLGCVQKHDPDFWLDEIGAAFLSEGLDGKIYAVKKFLLNTQVVSDLKFERLSVHQRVSGTTIGIYHLFIDCRP